MGRGQSSKTIRDKEHILRIINEVLADYLPVTVRAVHFKMVKDLLIENTRSQYQRISKLMTDMRLDGELEWWKVVDRSRGTVETKKWANLDEFYTQKLEDWKYYYRCRVQQQENYVEVWTEKDALADVLQKVTVPHCVKLVIVRGQVSTTYINDYADRAWSAVRNGQKPVIIYGGDLDPTGIQILKSIESRLHRTEFQNIGWFVKFHRFGLTPEQVEEYGLPCSIDAVKKTDPNYEKYVGEYGHLAVELDALDPPDLENILTDSLHKFLDMEGFDHEAEIEKAEKKKHEGILRKVKDLIDYELR